MGTTARLVTLALAAVSAVAVSLTKPDVDRYLLAAPILVAGLMIALARWNDL
ncbi:MAG: hypothetical protein M3M93_00650 [Actinomycetota bacterium]|nr:hypothetical protein [Actinomycetota bacterium]